MVGLSCTLASEDLKGEFLQLLRGGHHCEGLVQVGYHGQQGLLCGDSWDLELAALVCRQLDCGKALAVPTYVIQPEESPQVVLQGVHCQGAESSLWECSLGPWGTTWDCGCQCISAVHCSDGNLASLQLSGGSSPCTGTFEIKMQADIILKCGLPKEEASIFCRQLGCGSALQGSTAHLQGSLGAEQLKVVTCQGTETHIFNCRFNLNLLDQCDHSSNTVVVCSGHMEARLVGGDHTCAGLLEVRRGLTWGTICEADLDLPTANVICRERHCGSAVSTPRGAHFGRGSGPVWTEAFHCMGNESLLFDCPRGPGHWELCNHSHDAGLRCSGESVYRALRLRDGQSRCDGRVEISLDGVWSRVLDDAWDLRGAAVVCRQLQCGTAEGAYDAPAPGYGVVPVGLQHARCLGNESHLDQCNLSMSLLVPVESLPDAGVVCSGLGDLEVPPGEATYEVINDVPSPELYEETVGIEDEFQVSEWLLDPQDAHPALNEGGDGESFSHGYDDIMLEETAS
ncbi:PREDICTED: putative scavenger receptor cysteine-rich domain-containing protein LOC619207-like [Chrysochloris asiatica]|uniref:Scavenger receptor cysteine-rich domain-containing protein LOC619207-like n=1 Tax=Chrysochloris asiatica TaxID=185453 RepID=A0A9B0WUC0_CHRAS|nr:PREDICTED: putative scavenger receptor cysteine-rich domain-containing protein LOC619207-like [Chrysochloris asiatica]